MPPILKSVEQLDMELREHCNLIQIRIGMDGMDQVGKTTLAREAAHLLNINVVSLDCYLDKKRNAYAQHIRCEEVKWALEAATAAVIEGVCLREVAELCGFNVDVHIYVRRIGRSGVWYDEDICLAQEPVQQLKEKERALRQAFDKPGKQKPDGFEQERPGLQDELIDYHAKWRPVESADFIFDMVEADDP